LGVFVVAVFVLTTAFFATLGLITRNGNLGGVGSLSESRFITGGCFFGVGVVGYVVFLSFGGVDTDVSSFGDFGSISKNIYDRGLGSFTSCSESVLALLSLLISSAERFTGNLISSLGGTTIGGRTVTWTGFSFK